MLAKKKRQGNFEYGTPVSYIVRVSDGKCATRLIGSECDMLPFVAFKVCFFAFGF